AVPQIAGLAEAGYLTSETVFELERAPASITMLGGGPLAIEMAQAFARLGVRVTVLQKGKAILPRDEPDLVAILTRRLLAEGVDIRLDVAAERVGLDNGRKVVHGTEAGRPQAWGTDELLVAVGRRPNVEGLGLRGVGVTVGPAGVSVDGRMRTSVPSVYASGDVAGRYHFTHSAGYESIRAVRDMFFPGRGRVRALVPWCTFTDPELAHAGLTLAEAKARYGNDAGVWRLDLSHSDRARADGAGEGAVMIVTGRRNRVVGAHILAPAAGEMIHELVMAIERRLKLNQVASLIHVYPTMSTATGQLAARAAFQGARRFDWLVRRESRAR
ncbi:MAG TPA: FAD-dependent oxidoreductase, partial [Acidimicrobiales bacterium]|nr:FAD-dependent oxidoreductase [Acidimicrobiales bacterium]